MKTQEIQGTSQIQTNYLQNIYKEESPAGSNVGLSIIGVNNVQVVASPQRTVPIPALPVNACKRCIAEFCETNYNDQDGNTPLILAANRNAIREVARLLKTPFINVNSRNCLGLTAMHCAALGDHVDVLMLLLEAGAINLNHVDENGHTPLMLAAANGSHACVKVLCEDIRCNINAKDHWNRSALVLARPHPDIVDTLLQRPGIDIDTMTRLTVWLRSLPSLSTTLCCRRSRTQFSEENAGFMLMPLEWEDREDLRDAITCITNSSQNR